LRAACRSKQPEGSASGPTRANSDKIRSVKASTGFLLIGLAIGICGAAVYWRKQQEEKDHSVEDLEARILDRLSDLEERMPVAH
jgi:hypothetical protein